MEMENKGAYAYYCPGDLVKVRHDIDFVPTMFVVDKINRNIKNRDTGELEPVFVGIKCRWFDSHGDLQEAIFNTKDLLKIEQNV
jgi:NMD protein affecting ribosome stability and mRNA decay